MSGAAVAVTIDGTTFVNGATVSAGTGITVGNVAFVSSTRLTATFTIAADATGGARDVTVTNPGGTGGTLGRAVTVRSPQHATEFLAPQRHVCRPVRGGE